MSSQRPHVVIVGGGFGGLAAVRALGKADVDVTLVDPQPYNTFKPLLYQVATSTLNPGDITYFLRAASAKSPNMRFRQGAVTQIDPQAKSVTLHDGHQMDYDYLVIAAGVTTNYYGTPGAEEHTFSLYTRTDAIRLRDRIFAGLEQATRVGNGGDLRVVIIGGGATGVETAGALAELRNKDLPVEYPELDPSHVHVSLIEMGPALLPPFSAKSQEYARTSLTDRGVDVRTDTKVAAVRADGVELADGSFLPAGTIIWAAGVKGHDAIDGWQLPVTKQGRVEVDDHLRVVGLEGVYVVGDAAIDDAAPLPQLAQPALQGGRYAGRAIRAEVEGRESSPFQYLDKGILAVVGRNAAVAEIKHAPVITGAAAWAIWTGVHVTTLLSGRNRVATFANLTARYLSWGGGHNAIVGELKDS